MSGLVENAREPEKIEGKLAALRAKYPDGKGGIEGYRTRYQHVSQLPTWVKDAIRLHDIDGRTWRQIALKKGKAPTTVEKWMQTPAAKKMRAAIKEVIDDPVGTAKLRARIDADWAYSEAVSLYRECVAAGDRAVAARLLNHFADLAEAKTPATSSNGAIIQINLQGATFTTDKPMGESSATKVVEAEIVTD